MSHTIGASVLTTQSVGTSSAEYACLHKIPHSIWRSNGEWLLGKKSDLRLFDISTRVRSAGSGKRRVNTTCQIRNTLQEKLGGLIKGKDGKVTVTGTVILQRKNVLDLNSQLAAVADTASELLQQKVKLQLVSVDIDPETQDGRRSEWSSLEKWILTLDPITADKGTRYSVHFTLDEGFGTPGALIMNNNHLSEFFLQSVTLEMPDKSEIYFACNSWVYGGTRIFFANKVYLPSDTPAGLAILRGEELHNLQGDGTGERQEKDRIYDYDFYNDLGDADTGEENARPVLGGSETHTYPRRCRTGRRRLLADPNSESRASLLKGIYIPRDEQFGHLKQSDFLTATLQSFVRVVIPILQGILKGKSDFKSINEIRDLYTRGLSFAASGFQQLSPEEIAGQLKSRLQVIAELTDGTSTDSSILKFPPPQIIQADGFAWFEDDEFARQRLSGLNPVVIERLKVFPPESGLDPKIYGPLTSSITAEHIEGNLDGLTIKQALDQSKLFIVDYHDIYLPYLEKINALEGKAYASRTVFFLNDEGSLELIAIELTLPPDNKGEKPISRVFTRPPPGKNDYLWLLAKAHACINDAGYHELVSHWLRTHACIEPFIIATHRQLSSLHPLHLLLTPHFKNTMNINSFARQSLINYNASNSPVMTGIIEGAFTPGKYCLEMSSAVYKEWRFDEQGLPADLIKRGIAEYDSSSKHGLRLCIEDYPFAVDGLDIWDSIQSWVKEYLSIYYKDDKAVQEDTELQTWWKEIRTIGHGDKVNENWWVAMQSLVDLEKVLVTIIWVTSAHHAAVNFGQYAYMGFMPNMPTMARKLIPEVGTAEYDELLKDPEAFYLKMVSTPVQTTIVMATLEVLSKHASDEEYLGQRTTPNWTSDERVIAAFNRFTGRLNAVEEDIKSRNANPELRNRFGSAQIPYTLLNPTSATGLTGRGVPNSISI
eukprot:c22839_g2_i1 orf=70-2889(+)